MLDAISASQLAMELDQLKLQSITQNVANTNTPGFKRQTVEHVAFADYLSPSITSTAEHIQREQFNTQGTLTQTERPTDLALSGDAYFQVQNEQGVYYTRRGDCQINAKGELTTAHGDLLLGKSGAIQVDDNTFTIDRQGTIFIDHHKVDQLNIVHFNQTQSLRYVGNGLYQSYDATTPADGTARVLQGFIEQANVKSIDEMMDMTRISRHFESSQHVLRAANNLLASAINQLGEGNV